MPLYMYLVRDDQICELGNVICEEMTRCGLGACSVCWEKSTRRSFLRL